MSASTITAVPPAGVWAATLSELRLQMTKATFQTHLEDAQFITTEGSTYIIQVRNAYAADWLQNRLQDTIVRTLSAIAGAETAVCFIVDGQPPETPTTTPPPPEFPDERPSRPTEGYGGHLSPDERQALIDKIDARERSNGHHHPDVPQIARANQEHKRGPKHRVPHQKKRSGRGDQASIDVIERDPMKAHVETPHYAKRFWQPLLGLNAFALWELLRSYYFFVKYYGADQPTITLLCDTLGWKDRRTLLGREATESSKGYEGAVQVLANHGILKHVSDGEGSQMVHHFRQVLDDLPLLTPKQVAQLSKAKQIEHEIFLSHYNFDMDEWLTVTDETHVQETAAKRVL